MVRSALLLIVLIFAVSYARPPLGFGATAGLNTATMAGSDVDALEERVGSSSEMLWAGNGGFTVSYEAYNWLAVESGMHLSGKGLEIPLARQSGTEWSGGTPQSVSATLYMKHAVTFLELPLVLKPHVPFTDGGISPYAIAGMKFGIVTSAREVYYVNEEVTSVSGGNSSDKETIEEIDLLQNRTVTDSLNRQLHYTYDDFYRRTDLSLCFGAGLERIYSTVGLYISATYTIGLLNHNDLSESARKQLADMSSPSGSSNIVVLGDPVALFRVFQINAGFTIYLTDKPRPGQAEPGENIY